MNQNSNKYSVQYRIKIGDDLPTNYSQDETIRSDDPTWIPMPGDSVELTFDAKRSAFIVLTRHFALGNKHNYAHIVVRPATDKEMEGRISS